jgi:hypothetical protein
MINLLRYDLKNTTKKIVGYIVSLILFAFIVRFLWSQRFLEFFDDNTEFFIGYMIQYVSIGVLLCLTALMIIVIMVRQTQWFDENILSPQGQFTNMLPVATWQLVLSKILAALIWSFVTLLILIAICAVVFVHTTRLEEVIAFINDIGREANSPFTIVELVIGLSVFGVVTMCTVVSQCFLSLVIGQLFNSMRNFMIFLSFVVISAVVLFSQYVIMTTFGMESFVGLKSAADVLDFCRNVAYKGAAINFVLTFVYWFIASKLLKSNLNLL